MGKIKEEVICFPVRDGKVFLGRRKAEKWNGKISGFGGGVEYGETPELAQIREMFEETRVEILQENLIKKGKIKLNSPQKEKILHIFLIKKWRGEFKETKEMELAREYEIDNLPFNQMIKGDEIWIPLALNGYYFRALLKRSQDFSLEFFKFSFVSYIF